MLGDGTAPKGTKTCNNATARGILPMKNMVFDLLQMMQQRRLLLHPSQAGLSIVKTWFVALLHLFRVWGREKRVRNKSRLSHRPNARYSFRSASLNGIVRSSLPVESKT